MLIKPPSNWMLKKKHTLLSIGNSGWNNYVVNGGGEECLKFKNDNVSCGGSEADQ